MSINNEFRKEIISILSKASKIQLEKHTYFKSRSTHGQSVYYPNELAPAYLQAIRILRQKSNNTKKSLSDEALELKLDDFILKLLYENDQEKVKREIDSYIKGLFNEVAKMEPTLFLFLIPIMGLGVEANISINGLTIMRLTPENLLSIENENSVTILDERFKTYGEFIDEFKKENETATISVVAVQAFDSKKALELALEKTDMSLNILRLFWITDRSKFVIRDEYRSLILESFYSYNLTEGGLHCYDFTSRNQHIREGTYINRSEIIQIQERLRKIDSILSKEEDKRTELEKALITAIFWFGNGIKEHQKSMQFVQFIMAIEALLIPDGKSAKKQLIAERFTAIIFCDGTDSQRKDAFATMWRFYDLRNSIIHSGQGYVYNDDLNQVIYWARCLIQFLLTQTDKHLTIISLLDKDFPIQISYN